MSKNVYLDKAAYKCDENQDNKNVKLCEIMFKVEVIDLLKRNKHNGNFKGIESNINQFCRQFK